jgi:hypothetical protein
VAQLKLDGRVQRHEVVRPTSDQRAAEVGRRAHAQEPACRFGLLHDVLGFLDGAQQRRDALIVGASFCRQAQRARRALEEAHAEPTLQPRHALRDRRGRGADQPGGGAEGARLYRAHEADEARGLLRDRRHSRTPGKAETSQPGLMS